jgi:hypothetical protein
VSRIWDALKEAEQHRTKHAGHRDVRASCEWVSDRRCAERLWANIPLFVYGHTAEGEPFHERTEALHVNAGGALITLTAAVRRGQDLLLINEVSEREQKCHVVYQGQRYLMRAAVGIGFAEPVPDFWDIGRYASQSLF